jgi:hypothetical protein
MNLFWESTPLSVSSTIQGRLNDMKTYGRGFRRGRRPSPNESGFVVGRGSLTPPSGSSWRPTNRSPRSFSIPCCQRWALKSSRSKIPASSLIYQHTQRIIRTSSACRQFRSAFSGPRVRKRHRASAPRMSSSTSSMSGGRTGPSARAKPSTRPGKQRVVSGGGESCEKSTIPNVIDG